ncbi:MAG: GHKL domain-containing protein [Clostridia bacterium]
MEWTEAFLRPFTIVYSIVLVFVIDFALIESRFSRRIYLAITAPCAVLSCIALLILYRVGGLTVMQNDSIFAATLPSCVVYYFLSKHRGCRFFLAFCTADMACMAMIMLSMCVSMFFGGGLLSILLTRLLLITLMAIFMVKRVATPFCHIMNAVQRGWGAAAFVTMLFYLLLYGYFMFPTTIEKRPAYVPVGILILILLFSCYWFIYKTISWLAEIHQAEKTEQGLRLQLALQKEQYSATEERIKADQVFRHDLRHHAKLLTELLRRQNFDEALAYIQKLDSSALERTTKSYCENMVVNAVLSSQLGAAERLGIAVTCKAALPPTVHMDEMELCVVLSNLLENAIENCRSEISVPTLDVFIKSNKGQLCIRIQNSFGGKVRQDENGTYLSAKPQGGIGLKSVMAIVEKHQGAMNIIYEKAAFIVDIAL